MRSRRAPQPRAADSVPRRVGAAHVDVAGAMLARAFARDPMFTYIAPMPLHRANVLPALMTAGVRLAMTAGEAWQLPGSQACAAWMGPGQGARPADLEIAGFPAIAAALGPEATARLEDVLAAFASARDRIAPGPHWYLAILGVEPRSQRAGLGSALLEHRLAVANADGLPVYLESTNEANLPFYERHGFAVAESGETPGGLPYWALLREARAPLP